MESKDNVKMSDNDTGNPGTSKSNTTSRPSGSSQDTENVNLNVLLKFIKPFDGSRDKLNPFISNCQNAYSLASKSQKPILLKYILSQLEGRAETTCNIKDFDNFEQFITFMKEQFGEKKHYAHLLSELQECRQGISEPVNQFALRIETCLAKLLTEINISIPTKKKGELAGRLAAMEDLALHTFTVGLLPRLSQTVRNRDPESLNTAISFAVSEEKIMASTIRKTLPQHPNAAERPRFPPRRGFQFRPSNLPAPAPSNAVICRYCKNIGHTIENCRKRQFNNNRNQLGASTSQGRPNYQTPYQKEDSARRVHAINQADGVDEADDLNE